MKKHWIIRCHDGNNFRNSKYSFWGVKRGKNNNIKTIVNKIKKGDILWFLTSKSYGGKFIGMCEYSHYFDKQDEPLINLNTYSNEEQGWIGDEKWELQMHYYNYYDIEKINIKACIQCPSPILEYDRFREKINNNKEYVCENLDKHYDNLIIYGTISNKYN